MHPGKAAVCMLAAAGLVACWFVAAYAWEGHPPLAKVGLELAFFGLASAVVLTIAFNAPRVGAVPLAIILLGFGWLGTWAYGFLWVPGFAALLACCFRRPVVGAKGKRLAPANV